MSEAPQTPDAVRPQVIGVDSLWFDPYLMSAACTLQQTTQTKQTSAIEQLAPANARRFMLGFVPSNVNIPTAIYPYAGPTTFPFAAFGFTSQVVWVSIFTHGLIVCNQWFWDGGAGSQGILIEMIRN